MTFVLETDVPKSPEVTGPFPQELQAGRANDSLDSDDPSLTCDPFLREVDAFERMLPNLLSTRPGEFVAIYHQQIIGLSTDRAELIRRMQTDRPGCEVLIRRISSDQRTVYLRSPIVEQRVDQS